jgi:hypothetical protein
MTIYLVAFWALAAPADPHEKLNPVYRELRQAGVEVGAPAKVKMPEPLLADGLSAREQMNKLRELTAGHSSYDEFTRKSRVAPEKLVLSDVKSAGKNSATRRVQVICAAHGDLKVIADKKFLERVLDLNKGDGKAEDLPRQKLQALGIEVKDPDRESYGRASLRVLEKVQLDVTTHSYWSQTDDSIVAAGLIDPRFRDDKDHANQWRSLTKVDGKFKVGAKATPYEGAGYYVKFTRLAKPAGALFVEGHVLFQEPSGWFQGENTLRSKLPPAIQKQVRDFRLELDRAMQK